MSRRRVIIGLAGVALAAAVGALFWLGQPRPCRATFEQVRVGMSFDEVCATVGGEPGDYTGGRSLAYLVSQIGSVRQRGEERERYVWAADDGFLSVIFDHGRVTELEVLDDYYMRPEPSLFDRLCTRLGL